MRRGRLAGHLIGERAQTEGLRTPCCQAREAHGHRLLKGGPVGQKIAKASSLALKGAAPPAFTARATGNRQARSIPRAQPAQDFARVKRRSRPAPARPVIPSAKSTRRSFDDRRSPLTSRRLMLRSARLEKLDSRPGGECD